MRVLVANKFWYRRGGLEAVMFDEIAMLEEAGHEVAHFSTTHPDNASSPWEHYFSPYLEIGASGSVRGADALVAAARMFRNPAAARAFTALIDDFAPDIIHCHGIHRQISPSILAVAARRRIPVVQTLHDYHHICPADVLLRSGTTPCHPPLCGGLSYGSAVRHRCVRGSATASALSAAETLYQRFLRSYERGLAAFICPSDFLAEAIRADGWTVPLHTVRNAVVVPDAAGGDVRSGFAYAGRLSPEKGLDQLLQAASNARVRVTVAGDGPLRQELETEYPDVEFLGRIASDEVLALLRRSRAAVVPSVALENAPLAVLEAMAAGTAVVASRVGGVPELLEDGVEGILVPSNDPGALAAALRRLDQDPSLATIMGERGRQRALREYSRERHAAALLDVYETVLDRKRRT